MVHSVNDISLVSIVKYTDGSTVWTDGPRNKYDQRPRNTIGVLESSGQGRKNLKGTLVGFGHKALMGLIAVIHITRNFLKSQMKHIMKNNINISIGGSRWGAQPVRVLPTGPDSFLFVTE